MIKMNPSTKSSSIADRILYVEEVLGSHNLDTHKTTEDLQTRISNVQNRDLKKILTYGNGSLERTLNECKKLERKLDPGALLTYQMMSSSSAKNAPLLYRRQDIIASKETFQKDLDQLIKIRDLLLMKQNSNASKPKSSFANCSIVSSSAYESSDDPEMIKRLDAATSKAMDLNARASKISSRLDMLLNRYQHIVVAASEKLVLIDEELCELENERLQ